MRSERTRFLRFVLTAALAVLACPAVASAERSLTLGLNAFSDELYRSPAPEVRDLWFDRSVNAGAKTLIFSASWRGIAPGQPSAAFNPRDPGDPQYSWGTLDLAIRDARTHGLRVMILVTRAPGWAEGPDEPGDSQPGTWKPSPSAIGDFGAAIARRYSGQFVDPAAPGEGPLPAVDLFELWAEPNLSDNLTPQWEGGKPSSPDHYRRMLNAFYPAVKGQNPKAEVVTGGLAPFGDDPSPGGQRMRPLAFFRELLCLHGRKALEPTKCKSKPKFDVLAHNAITFPGGANYSAVHPDDVTAADVGNVTEALRAAERGHTTGTSGRHPLWVTEFWWASNPPNPEAHSAAWQARTIAQALYNYWKAGASAAFQLRISDAETDPGFVGATGLYFGDGKPKPALTAFRFPFVTERKSDKKVLAWGRAPTSGKVTIEEKAGNGWRKVHSERVKTGEIFTTNLKAKGEAKLRARVSGENSLVWTQRR